MWVSQAEIGGHLGQGLPVFFMGGRRMKKQMKQERRKLEAELLRQGMQIEERAVATTEAAMRGQTAVLRQTTRLLAGIVGIAVLVTLLPTRN